MNIMNNPGNFCAFFARGVGILSAGRRLRGWPRPARLAPASPDLAGTVRCRRPRFPPEPGIGSAAVESLSVAVGGLAAELGALPLPSSDVLKLVGGAVLLAAMWRWTTPKSARGHSRYRRR
jgi:hypothetical protein